VFVEPILERGGIVLQVKGDGAVAWFTVDQVAVPGEMKLTPPGPQEWPFLFVAYLHDVVTTVSDFQPHRGQGGGISVAQILFEKASCVRRTSSP
jgi:hypothetical protein